MEERIYKVYKHTFPDGMIYIGMTKHTVQKRIELGYQHNLRMKDAMSLIDKRQLKTEIIEDNLTKEEADAAEIKYIAQFNSTDPNVGYNISKGGVKTFKGLKHTEKYKKHMSDLFKGRTFSEEHRKNLSDALKGNMVGEKNPMYGKPKSKETIEKQYQAHKHEMKSVIQKDFEGNILNVFFSIHEASRKTGIARSCIHNCLIGKQKSSKGFFWEYTDIKDNN